MNKERPINLELSSLKFPPMAIASILHRVSGIILFILLPLILYIFSSSLHSLESFNHLKIDLHNPFYKLMLWGFGASLIYHVIAGIRHLIMDYGYGEELHTARKTALVVIIISVILSIFLGIWICKPI